MDASGLSKPIEIADPAGQVRPSPVQRRRAKGNIFPGLTLCVAVTLAALGVEAIETREFGHPYADALVMAILLGAAIRTAWKPNERWQRGIDVSAKLLLEIAVVLLGASVSLQAAASAGPMLLVGIAAVVLVSLGASFATGRLLGLNARMATLVACGNSICGNSAIAAVAPVIHAEAQDIASSVAFTAVLGILVVLGLPILIPLLGLSPYAYGVLAGMTVYAVPQVIAATAPIGLLSTQVGTLVKLVRVLMLAPIVMALSIAMARCTGATGGRPQPSLRLSAALPWFIAGFLLLAAARSSGVIPRYILPPISAIAGFLTLVSMAALGLGVDFRAIRQVGGRAVATVTISLIGLLGLSVVSIRLLSISG